MFKSLKGKSRFVTALCCLFLGLALIIAGAFTVKATPSAVANAETASVNGFVVNRGASIRYQEDTPGIRFTASVTKAQYEEWKADLATKGFEDTASYTMNFFVMLQVEGIKDQDGNLKLNANSEPIVYYEPITTPKNIHLHDWTKGDFTFPVAIFLDTTWNDEASTAKTNAELFNMYADAKFSVQKAVMLVNGSFDKATGFTKAKGTSAYYADLSASTERTMRTIANSLFAKETDPAKVDLQKAYLKNDLGELATFISSSNKEHYDMSADKAVITIEDLKTPISSFVATYRGQDITSNTAIDGNTITVTGLNAIKDLVKKGQSGVLVIDTGTYTYTFTNLIGVTKIITTVEEFQEVFDLNYVSAGSPDVLDGATDATSESLFWRDPVSTGYGLKDSRKIVEEFIDENGVTHSLTFWGKSAEIFRGYYVLGADIDFGGTFENKKGVLQQSNGYTRLDATVSGGVWSGSTNVNGLFGFGGTFDGNGYEIKNVRFQSNANGDLDVSGVFGSLAYGAQISNLVVTNILPTTYLNSQKDVVSATNVQYLKAFIATGIGDSANFTRAQNGDNGLTVQDYLIAKYGTTDTISIKDAYIELNDDKLSDYGTTSDWFTVDGATYDDYIWYAPVAGSRYDFTGSINLFLKADEQCASIENLVYSLPNPGVNTMYRFETGFTKQEPTADTVSAFNNCYLISAPGTTPNALQKMTAVWNSQYFTINDNGVDNIGLNNTSDEYYPLDYVIGHPTFFPNRNGNMWLAKNDYAVAKEGFISGGANYSRRENEGNVWTWKTNVEENGGTNVSAIEFASVMRYDSIEALIASEDAGLLKLNQTIFNVTDSTAPFVKGGDKGFKVTMLDQAGQIFFEKGDVITVTATQNGKAVPAEDLVITVENPATFALSANQITLNDNDAQKVTVSYNLNGTIYAKTYILKTESAFNELVYVSALEGLIDTSYDETAKAFTLADPTSYSAVYVPVADSNDYTAITLEQLYKNLVDDQTAVFEGVYQSQGMQGHVKIDLVEVDGVKYLNYAEPEGGIQEGVSYVLNGSKGSATVGNVTIVTNVIKDTIDFKYVPSSKTSINGYYVIANDYDTNTRANGYTGQGTNALNTKILYETTKSGYTGFTFGYEGLAEDGETKEYKGFNGTIDGLGHTLNNVEAHRYGLLGRYDTRDEAGTLKNVMFTNLRASRRYWDGTYKEGTDGVTYKHCTRDTDHSYFSTDYATGITDAAIETHRLITFENVYAQLATDTLDGGQGQYAPSLGYTGLANSSSSNTAAFAFFSVRGGSVGYGGRHARFAIKDCVFNYQISEVYGSAASAYGGGVLISFFSAGYEGARATKVFANMSNNFIISPDVATANGKPVPLYSYIYSMGDNHGWENMSSSAPKSLQLVGYAENEFNKFEIPVANEGDIFSTDKVGLHEGKDAEGNWVIGTTPAATPHTNLGSYPNRTYVKMAFNRYYDYTTMLGDEAQKTVGGFVITADGVAWNK